MLLSLISTKIHIPPRRASAIIRYRLFERLNEGKRCKLTLISASAGFGKTTLLSDWCYQSNEGISWVALDESDNDSIRFWTYVIAALQTHVPTCGQASLIMLQSTPTPPATTFLTSLINDLSNLNEHLILVLDDYHVIEEKAIHDGLMFLLEHLPSSLHLFIAGRIDPPLPLARLRIREHIIEIRDTDLRFTKTEASTLFRETLHLPLSERDVLALEERTEGWIAGLQLAALSLQHRSNVAEISERVQAFTGSNRFILDYLVDEVIYRQPAHIQQFLLQTSLLRRFNASLCEAVTGREDSQSLLEQLEHNNVFIIPLDDERQWYRYHALFGDVLQARLTATQRASIPELHVRAAQWYEQHALLPDAIRHALSAKAYSYAAQYIEDAIEDIWKSGELTTFITWVQALPEEILHSRLWLCTIYTWVLFLTIHEELAFNMMHYVERELVRLDEHKDKPLYRPIRGMVAAIQAMIAVMHDEYQRIIVLSQQALEQMPEEMRLWQPIPAINLGFAYQATGDVVEAQTTFLEASRTALSINNLYFALTALNGLSMAHIVQGNLHQAMNTCQQAQALLIQMGEQLPVAGYTSINRGIIEYEWNHLESAIEHLRHGIQQGLQWHGADIVQYGQIGLAYALLSQRDFVGVRQSWEQAHTIVEKVGSDLDKLEVMALQVRLWLAEGNLTDASTWALQWEANGEPIDFRHEVGNLTCIRVYIAQKQYENALRLLARLLPVAEKQHRTKSIAEILVLQAIVLECTHAHVQALTSLTQALTLTKSDGYIRHYVNEGEPLFHLLKILHITWQQSPQQDTHALSEYISTLIQSYGYKKDDKREAQGNGNSTLIEPLSERELEVLHMLVQGASNQDIADTLVITLSTVKKHVGNILAKLSVTSRTQAIVRARELHML